MSGVLVVRPSSLGDVVYALALVSDIAAHRPGVAVDWVAEDAFVDLVRLDPADPPRRARSASAAGAIPL
jgi:ADP-heptose:LPS heptosyltransferase